jgi:DNA topoisomerase II
MSKSNKNDEKTIEERYKNKTHHNHILEIPDTYIGSVNSDIVKIYTFDDETNKITFGEKTINEGLFKIFDEILVNASDNSIRDPTQDTIKVNIEDDGTIEVYNNGKSIPICIHKELNIYIPEMIFSKLLSSENYDTKGKIVGGKNGYGAKLTNIYSTYFEIEVVNTEYGKKYNQIFRNNMFDKEEPIVKNCSSKTESYVKIRFTPDYKRFGMKKLTNDMKQLFKRRVYDIAGTSNRKMNVYYNDEKIKINSFEDYIKLYYDEEPNIIYHQFNERWTIGIVYDTMSGHRNISFVNRIATTKGGTHVKYIMEQIIEKITLNVKKKNKSLDVKPSNIKDNITLFLNCVVEDPDFGSQSKDVLKTKQTLFNVGCSIDDKFIKKICDTGLLDDMVKLSEFKKNTELEKMNKNVGGSKDSLRDIIKLKDAFYAGKKRNQPCYLFLTEGDSGATTAISGLSIIGNEYYGVFPLKGVPLNTMKATNEQILKNEEIKNIMRIIGLKIGTTYEDTKKLRYDGIIILVDADKDATKIAGLIMNFINQFWPSLINFGFIKSLETPIMQVYNVSDVKKQKPIEKFYTELEYKEWCEKNNIKFNVSYYKGLGSWTSQDSKMLFDNITDKLRNYCFDDTKDDNIFAKFFEDSKDRINERKEMIMNYCKNTYPTIINNTITFHEFFLKVMIHFSYEDNVRSLPNLTDGFKPSLRKVIFGAFKRKLKSAIKTAQLAGYVSELGYHHGEMSLVGTIYGLCQNFVGSNNINLLHPAGQLGTRRMGGNDAASSRYTFTYLSDITEYIFRKEDEPILHYELEDGEYFDPVEYYPIIPIILINNCDGIGTGFSNTIYQYNPLDIITNIKSYLNNENMDDLTPWYKNFKGTIERKTKTSFLIKGCYKQINENTIIITELPIGTWTNDYLAFLLTLTDHEQAKDDKNKKPKNAILEDFYETPLEDKIHITVIFKNGELQKLLKNENDIVEKKNKKKTVEEELKLVSSISTTNMHCWKNGVITKYEDPNDILKDYSLIRLQKYSERIKYILQQLEREMKLLHYKKKFIDQKIKGKIIIDKRKKDDILQDLEKLKYPMLSNNEDKEPSYDYLTSILLFHFTEEKIEELNNAYNKKEEELNYYKNITPKDLWLKELEEFKDFYVNKFIPESNTDNIEIKPKKMNKKKK